MKLMAYRKFRPHEKLSARARTFYSRTGITESFIREIEYDGIRELGWAYLARQKVGRIFSKKLRKALAKKGIQAEIEARPKTLKRIINKLTRVNRLPGREPTQLSKLFFASFNLPEPIHRIGSVGDMYGIRAIIPSSSSSRDTCYDVLELVFSLAKIADQADISHLVDYLSYHQHRFRPDGTYSGRYESLHISFIYLGVPIEIQIRDTEMDFNAKHIVKRQGGIDE
jgi:(p)ppGpp synthase/HD superfamily hydrolase